MSLVLGRLARHTDNRGDAVTYWAAAEELAADAGDESLRATALIDRTHYSSATGALDLALAYAGQHEVQRSCGCLSRAIDVGATFQLSEQLQRLAQPRRRHLSAWQDEPAVRQLDEQLHTATQGLITP